MTYQCEICHKPFDDLDAPYWYCSLKCENKASELRRAGHETPRLETRAWAKRRYYFYKHTGGTT